MTLHKEGKQTLLLAPIFLVGLSLLIHTWLGKGPAFYGISIWGGLVYLLLLNFFRIPEKNLVKDENLIVAPCDGKVVVIEEVFEPEYFKDKRIQISIFMSPLNVHANYFPISGMTKYAKYHPGLFLVAWHPKSSTDNERTTFVVEHKNGTEILFRQIAGAVARRICYYAEVGKEAKQAEEFGFIKFGSRIDVFLPLDLKINVKVGDIVKSKLTSLASFK